VWRGAAQPAHAADAGALARRTVASLFGSTPRLRPAAASAPGPRMRTSLCGHYWNATVPMINSSRTRLRLLVLAGAAVLLLACSDRELRGKSVASKDGKTYLVVDDDNGGACGPILVDRKQWSANIHEPSEVSPGVHEISCGAGDGIKFQIRAGTTFHFNYWGP
jgi:hypothetical protein